jgi:hypothetical protein
LLFLKVTAHRLGATLEDKEMEENLEGYIKGAIIASLSEKPEDADEATHTPNLAEFLEDTIKATIISALAGVYENQDPLYTRQEAADYLRIKINTLSIWCTEGRGPAPSKLGSRTLYRKSALDEFITKNTLPR